MLLAAGALAARADDKAAATTGTGLKLPKPKGEATFEYTYPPLPPEKPKRAPELKPLPRVGSWAWLQRMSPRSPLPSPLAHWEQRRLGAYLYSEMPPTANDFSSSR
jgi:hypothetical protein